MSSNSPYAITAALLTQASMRPKRASVASDSASTAASADIGPNDHGPAVSPALICNPLQVRLALRAASTSFAPRTASCCAVARPIPLDAPATTTTQPSISRLRNTTTAPPAGPSPYGSRTTLTAPSRLCWNISYASGA